MLIAYQGKNPVFFRKEDIERIERIDPVHRGTDKETPVPAVRVVLKDIKYIYFLDDADARAAFREVLFQNMELETAKVHFPEAWID